MGRSVDIDFEFAGPVDVATVIAGVLRAGWTYGEEPGIRYMADDHGWRTADEQALPAVIGELEETLASGEAAGVSFWHPAEGTGGNLLFMPDGTLSFLPVHSRKSVSERFPEFTDNGWYVSALLPALADLGLVSIRTNDSYP